MTEKILKIKIGEEYKVKVENVGEFDESMFKDVYGKAFDCIKSILADNSKEESFEKYNNIVSFVGDRGTGKTSAMLSISGALKNGKDIEVLDKNKKDIKAVYNGLKKENKFFDIGVIDPSHFNENSNILEIILAKMFKKFKNKVEDTNKGVDHDDKRNLIKAFEEVFENLKTIQNPKDVYKGESLDALLKMSASTDLKENMTDLVKKYLKFFNKSDDDSNKKNGVLLLEIDDIDLSTKHAYEMVEQIRKYLIIPNVVILMAVKMEQLSHIVERNMRIEFEIMLEKSHMNDEEPKNMAEKYLEKLIPLDRRLFLPTLEGINLDIDLIIQDKEGKEYIIGKDGNKEIKNIIRYLIFKRTGNMFFNTDTQVSYIIPRTLRELVNLVSKLIAMKNNDKREEIKKIIEDKEKTIIVITLDNLNPEQKNKNYESFKEYFLSYWVESTLKSNHVEVIREVIKRDIKERNKYIVRVLNQEYLEKFEEIKTIHEKRTEVSLEGEYSKIVDFANKSTNISLGDLLLVLDLINRLIVDTEDKKFIFAIKTTYSIMLYGLIRDIKRFNKSLYKDLEKTRKINPEFDETQALDEFKKIKSKEIINRNNKIDEYRSLLGQNLYNSIQYKKLEELTFEYEAKDIGIDSNKFRTIKELKADEFTLKEMEDKIKEMEDKQEIEKQKTIEIIKILKILKILKTEPKINVEYKKTTKNDTGTSLELATLHKKFEFRKEELKNDFKELIKKLTTVSGAGQEKRRDYSIEFTNFTSDKYIYRFDILGFFYNDLERPNLKCYIGNIELLERILNIKKIFKKNVSFIENWHIFIKNYKDIIKKDFEDNTYNIFEDDIIKELNYFYKKYNNSYGYKDIIKKLEKNKNKNTELKMHEKIIKGINEISNNAKKEETLKEYIYQYLGEISDKERDIMVNEISNIIKLEIKETRLSNKGQLKKTSVENIKNNLIRFIKKNTHG